jgi:hypothetical protein
VIILGKEILNYNEWLAMQCNLSVRREAINAQLERLETHIDEKYDDIVNIFTFVNRNIPHLRESADNLDRHMEVNDTNMGRRMGPLERAIANIGHRHRHQ